ncbi:MAG: hypothetical protein ACKOC8_04865 [Pirellulales bacterium]
MITKVLAWSSFGLGLLFVILTLISIFSWESLGEETAYGLVVYGAVPLLVVSILLAITLLVMSAFSSDS